MPNGAGSGPVTDQPPPTIVELAVGHLRVVGEEQRRLHGPHSRTPARAFTSTSVCRA